MTPLFNATGKPFEQPKALDLGSNAVTEFRPLNRTERRAGLKNLMNYRRAAARARDKAASLKGEGTPARPISTDIRTRGLGHRWTEGPWAKPPLRRGARKRDQERRREGHKQGRIASLIQK